MPHRAHLRSLRLGSALRESLLAGPYGARDLGRDLLAGLTVGIIAIPLAMALAVASGVAPQHGLYTALVGGLVIALAGGSRYSVSGPTAAFVVILYPVAGAYGLAGLAVATLLAGLMLIGMAVARLGRLIEYIPEPVTLGFTAGIAIVLVLLQVPDFLGLPTGTLPDAFPEKLVALASALPGASWASALVGGVTLVTLVAWPRLRLPLPGHLPAILAGLAAAALLAHWGHPVDTIASRFDWSLPDGTRGSGIPPVLPEFTWPWRLPGPGGEPLAWDLATVRSLLPAAFSIAMLAAIESLLCAVVLDGMSGRRHHANGELLGQGLGNLAVPFFGGITATAAIARSAANFRAGARSPVAAATHALVVGLALLALAPVLGRLPMSALAGLLFVTAWNLSEAPKLVRLWRRAPLADVLVLMTCLTLTVVFDMIIAITVGVVMAALLFMREISVMTRITDVSDHPRYVHGGVPEGWSVYRINGPLFFAAADRVFSELAMLAAGRRGVVLAMENVALLDAGGLSALERFLADDPARAVVLVEPQFQPLKALARARLMAPAGPLRFAASVDEALGTVGGCEVGAPLLVVGGGGGIRTHGAE